MDLAQSLKEVSVSGDCEGYAPPLMTVPLRLASMETAMPIETRKAPHLPIAIWVAADAGTEVRAIAVAGMACWIAAFIPM